MSVTLVTAFLHLPTAKRDEVTYRAQFAKLVACKRPTVLFLDRRSSWDFPPHVRVIPVSLEETWGASIVPDSVDLPLDRSPVDTRDYMLVMTAKTEFVSRAAAENPFGTDWFAWVDFGIGHVFKTPEETFARLAALRGPEAPCLRTAGIWTWTPDDLSSRVCWRFAGGFFLAHRTLAPIFDAAVRASIVRRLPSFTWEVNTWADVERHGLTLGWFPADHTDSLIPFTDDSQKP
jgi:hypothetical protein